MQKVLLNKIITERLTVKQLEDEIKKIVGPTTDISLDTTPKEPSKSMDDNTASAISAINKLMNSQNPITQLENNQSNENLSDSEV